MFRLRMITALLLMIVALAILASEHFSRAALKPLTGVVAIMAAIVLLLGPWWLRIARDSLAERQARIRAEERAEMASRVHDSVLQTLALIQRRARDPNQVVSLARAQERELRSWLFDGRAPGSLDGLATTLAGGVRLIQQEVEAQHGIVVEAISVGDCALDDDLAAVLAAARGRRSTPPSGQGHRHGLALRRGRARRGLGVRQGPGPWLRPGGSARGPQGAGRVGQGQDGATRRLGDGPQHARRGHGGRADHAADRQPPRAEPGDMSDPRPTVFIVDDHGLFRSGVRSELGELVNVVGRGR